MAEKIVLVTGGARSGKSLFAEKYAANCNRKIAYIATAQIYDEEMKLRVNLHRQRRPQSWVTYEAPYDAESAILKAARQASVVLFDCLTIYTSNLLLSTEHLTVREERYQFVMNKLTELINSARSCQATVIFVTNEVGMGIVPDNALAREYRDLAGMANQIVAANADEVYLVISGLAVDIKKLAVKIGEEERYG